MQTAIPPRFQDKSFNSRRRQPYPYIQKPWTDIRHEICQNYLNGCCRYGPSCYRRHPDPLKSQIFSPPKSVPIKIPPRELFPSPAPVNSSSNLHYSHLISTGQSTSRQDAPVPSRVKTCSTPYAESDTSSDESYDRCSPRVRLCPDPPPPGPYYSQPNSHDTHNIRPLKVCPQGYCHDWCRGRCNFGNRCRYLHRPHFHSFKLPDEPKPVKHPHPRTTELCWAWEHDRCYEEFDCPFVHGDLQYDSPVSEPASSSDEDSSDDGNVIKCPRPRNSAICVYWRRGHCHRGSDCQFFHPDAEYEDAENTSQINDGPAHQLLHPRPLTNETCRNWLRGICRLGYDCKYLHQDLVYDDPIPELHKGFPIFPRNEESPARCLQPVSEWTVFVHDHIRLKVSAGFQIQELVTGFETPWLFVEQLPAAVTDKAILALLSPFGKVELKSVTRSGGTVSVKAKYSEHVDARNAANSLDDTMHFGQLIRAHLSMNVSSSGGRLEDCDIRIQWDAPGLVAYGGFPTLDRAQEAVAAAQKPFQGRLVRARIHEGLPAVGMYTVKFWNIPVDIKKDKDALKTFAEPEGVMWEPVTYTSAKESISCVRKILDYHFDVLAWDVSPPPYTDGLIRVHARFATSLEASQAADHLHIRKPGLLGGTKVFAYHSKHIAFKLSNQTYDGIKADLMDLRATTSGSTGIVVTHFESMVKVKLSSDDLKDLGRLKQQFESILRGKVVMLDGKIAWDQFFSFPSGILWIDGLRQRHPDLQVFRNAARRRVILHGPSAVRAKAHAEVVAKILELRSRTARIVPLSGQVLGSFMVSQYPKLKEKLGEENVTIDLWNRNLVVRGSSASWLLAKDAVQRASEAQQPSRTRSMCPICFDEVDCPFTLRCGHAHCRSCLREYLLAATDSRFFPLTCLGEGANCTELIPLSAARGILTTDEFNAVVNSAYSAFVAKKADEFHHCPTPDCPQVYRTAPKGMVLQCPACLSRICSSCHGESHDGVECPRDEGDENELAFKEWKKSRGVKPCPGCKIDIERAEGCNHVTCIRCNTHICWECLRTFRRGEGIYEHMRAAHGSIGLIPQF